MKTTNSILLFVIMAASVCHAQKNDSLEYSLREVEDSIKALEDSREQANNKKDAQLRLLKEEISAYQEYGQLLKEGYRDLKRDNAQLSKKLLDAQRDLQAEQNVMHKYTEILSGDTIVFYQEYNGTHLPFILQRYASLFGKIRNIHVQIEQTNGNIHKRKETLLELGIKEEEIRDNIGEYIEPELEKLRGLFRDIEKSDLGILSPLQLEFYDNLKKKYNTIIQNL